MSTPPKPAPDQPELREISRRIAADLLEIGALAFSPDEPFTWASGIRSPIYCDNRITLGYPLVRNRIREGFEALVADWLAAADVIVGTATAGIPHAAWLAESLALPMAYVRSSAKGHGKQNRIEGRLPKDARVVIIEDLISTGGSSISAADAVTDAGARVLGVASIFTYRLPEAEASFEQAGLHYQSLTDLPSLLDLASTSGALTSSQVESIRKWRMNPKQWKGGA